MFVISNKILMLFNAVVHADFTDLISGILLLSIMICIYMYIYIIS